MKREQRIQDERERHAIIAKDDGNRFVFNEKVKLLREIGPPWTWLHDFSEQSCRPGCGSFNFIDEESICSDETLAMVSGDESFDYVTEKPINTRKSVDDHPPEEAIKEGSDASVLQKESSCMFHIKLSDLKERLEKETSVGGLDISCTDSVISCLAKEEYNVLKGAGEEHAENIDIKEIIKILETSKDDGVKFHSLAEMLNYVSLQLPGELRFYCW